MLKQRFEVTIVDIYRATLKAFSLSKRTLLRYSQLLFQIEIECKALENDVNSQTNLILFHKVSHVISSRKYQVSVLELENVVFKIEFFFQFTPWEGGWIPSFSKIWLLLLTSFPLLSRFRFTKFIVACEQSVEGRGHV